MAMPLNYGSGGGRDQRGAGRVGVGPGSLGHAPRSGGRRDPLGLFPSTSISQQTLNQLLSGARTQVQANYAPSALPTQQSYLQPYEDRRAQNKSLADAAAGYLQGASSNAQTLSTNLIGGLTGAIQGGAQATVAAGGSGLPGAIPTAAQATAGAQQIGSSWANFLNALIPAQAAMAQEADAGVTRDENSAIANYRKAQDQRTTDMQGAIQTLYKGNLDTLKAAKDSDYRNALSLYAILGKDKYEKLRIKQQAHEFDVNTGLRKRSLDQGDTRINNTEAYRQSSLDIQRKKAAKETGIDTAPALRILNSGKAVAAAGVKTGPLGQIGAVYNIYPVGVAAADSPTGKTEYIRKNPVVKLINYGDPVPVNGPDKPLATRVRYVFPHTKAGSAYGPTADSYARATAYLRSLYGKRITSQWLSTYFPPPPAA